MVKLKNSVSEETTEQVQTKETTVVQAKEKITAGGGTVASKDGTVPDYVNHILRMYPAYNQLAIDPQGGVYVEGSQHLSKGKAILYQNPYYK